MKRLLRFTLGVLSAASIASCGNSSEPTDEFKPTMDKETACSIKVVGSYDNNEPIEKEFDKFNKIYPNVKLSYTKIDDYNNSIATVLEGNDKPNIFFSYTWMMGNDKYSSVVSHMENLSDPALKFNLNCIRPGLINRDEQGNALMVPVFSRTYGMLLNDDLFKKENLSVPTTWAELQNVCKAFSDKGYKNPMMGYSLKSSSSFMNTVAYPAFVATLSKNKEALDLANKLDPTAGKYMKESLEAVKALLDNGCINLEECDKIADNYAKVIFRFFEGDVPMMVCTADTVSGTKKREKESEEFTASPFNYSFAPIPLTDQGGYFIDSPSVEFSVNKNCENLDMTNEFMRFLITSKELNQHASYKGLLTPSKQISFDSVYAPFGAIPEERTFSPEVLGIKDQLVTQIRVAAHKVGRGELTIDEAIAQYGTFQ